MRSPAEQTYDLDSHSYKSYESALPASRPSFGPCDAGKVCFANV